MGSIDKELQQRVWQRVQGGRTGGGKQQEPEPDREQHPAPEGLLLEIMTDGAALRALAGRTGDPAGAWLRQIARQLDVQAGILRGICRLQGVTPPKNVPASGRPGNTEAALRTLTGSLLRRADCLERLCACGEFAAVYRELACQTRQCLLTLLRAVGHLCGN